MRVTVFVRLESQHALSTTMKREFELSVVPRIGESIDFSLSKFLGDGVVKAVYHELFEDKIFIDVDVTESVFEILKNEGGWEAQVTVNF